MPQANEIVCVVPPKIKVRTSYALDIKKHSEKLEMFHQAQLIKWVAECFYNFDVEFRFNGDVYCGASEKIIKEHELKALVRRDYLELCKSQNGESFYTNSEINKAVDYWMKAYRYYLKAGEMSFDGGKTFQDFPVSYKFPTPTS